MAGLGLKVGLNPIEISGISEIAGNSDNAIAVFEAKGTGQSSAIGQKCRNRFHL
jgi:hypothetical protein